MPCPYFNPRGLRRPRRSGSGSSFHMFIFQSTRPSQTSTTKLKSVFTGETISIHEAFADLDASIKGIGESLKDFNPRGLRRPRRCPLRISWMGIPISIHEAFADLDPDRAKRMWIDVISIHEAFADLDKTPCSPPYSQPEFQSTRPSQTSTGNPPSASWPHSNFNPRGLRRPRLGPC